MNVSESNMPCPLAPGGGTCPSVAQDAEICPVPGCVEQMIDRPVLERND